MMNQKPKPILKCDRKPKKIKRQNHYKPGFVYLFYDPLVNLCKAGLSRTPKRRRYYLSQEYQSDLIIKAIVPTMNMKLTEALIHKMFEKHNILRTRGLDGYTEWFAANFFRIVQMQVSVYLLAILVNFLYLAIVAVMILTIIQLMVS